MKLEHLAPYLPYKLKAFNKYMGHKLYREVEASNMMSFIDKSTEAKPVMRPLSEFKYQDIIKVQKHLGVGKWCDYYDLFFDAWFDDSERLQNLALQMPFELMQFFLKNHFDVFGLIEKGEAIDINTL